ncbi:MAG: glycosyltransferase, partial [Rhodospirillales bacterium]
SVSAERLAQLAKSWGNLEEPSPIILVPGAVNPLRGQIDLVRALGMILRTNIKAADATLIIAGAIGRTDSYARELSRVVKNLSLQKRVFIAGELDDMPAAMLMADVVASVPTRPLGQDPTAAMAAALGKPVIGASTRATEETLE